MKVQLVVVVSKQSRKNVLKTTCTHQCMCLLCRWRRKEAKHPPNDTFQSNCVNLFL